MKFGLFYLEIYTHILPFLQDRYSYAYGLYDFRKRGVALGYAILIRLFPPLKLIFLIFIYL